MFHRTHNFSAGNVTLFPKLAEMARNIMGIDVSTTLLIHPTKPDGWIMSGIAEVRIGKYPNTIPNVIWLIAFACFSRRTPRFEYSSKLYIRVKPTESFSLKESKHPTRNKIYRDGPRVMAWPIDVYFVMVHDSEMTEEFI